MKSINNSEFKKFVDLTNIVGKGSACNTIVQLYNSCRNIEKDSKGQFIWKAIVPYKNGVLVEKRYVRIENGILLERKNPHLQVKELEDLIP